MFNRSISAFVFFVLLLVSGVEQKASAQSNNGFAVVLIDMQLGFYERGGTTDSVGLNRLVYNQSRLLKWSVQNKVPVIVLEYEKYGVTDPRLVKLLTGHTYKIIEKNQDGGFHGKSREEMLRTLASWKVDSLIIAGINGPYCVKATITGALESGFDVMTTSWVIGNINHNPPTFPNGSWYFKNNKFTVFPTLESIIQ